MKDLEPDDYDVKKALDWVASERAANPKKSLTALVHEAARKFDLSPKDEEFLLRQVTPKRS